MGKKKKKKKGDVCRIAATVAVILAAGVLSSCAPLSNLLEHDPVPVDPNASAGTTPSETPAVVAGTALEVATWVLAALGLGPLSRVLMASKPVVVKLAELVFGKSQAKPTTEKPNASA